MHVDGREAGAASSISFRAGHSSTELCRSVSEMPGIHAGMVINTPKLTPSRFSLDGDLHAGDMGPGRDHDAGRDRYRDRDRERDRDRSRPDGHRHDRHRERDSSYHSRGSERERDHRSALALAAAASMFEIPLAAYQRR